MSRIVVVSGGGTGIGRAVAQVFALDGDHVALLGRRGDKLADAAAEIGDKARVPVGTFAADLTDPEQTDRVRQWVRCRARPLTTGNALRFLASDLHLR